jgi:hypothetical protein
VQIPPLPPIFMRMSIQQRIDRENYINTIQVLQDLRRERDREYWSCAGGTGALGKADVSVVGFMGANPNNQIAFAASEGFFPNTELYYQGEME